MSNGEVVFEAPWQGRIFGMARAMAERGVFEWEELRRCLIDELAGQQGSPEAPFAYYDHFQRALERLLAGKGILPRQSVSERVQTLAARPHGHDHHGDHNDRR